MSPFIDDVTVVRSDGRPTPDQRVEAVERKVERLEQLPDRISSLESQILQFREEVRAEFSNIRGEMHQFHDVSMNQMRVLHEDVVSRIALLNEGRNGPKPDA